MFFVAWMSYVVYQHGQVVAKVRKHRKGSYMTFSIPVPQFLYL